MIELFNLKLIYEKEITFAICFSQPSHRNRPGRLPLRHLSGAGRAWHVRECVAPIEANGATFRRKIRHRGELLTLPLPRYGRAERQYSPADNDGRFRYMIKFTEKGMLQRQTRARGERFQTNTPQAQTLRAQVMTRNKPIIFRR